MITAMPVAYGYTVLNTVPTVPLPSFDAWITVPDVARILQASQQQTQHQHSQTQLEMEQRRQQEQLEGERRHGYVVAQQHLRTARPSFTDPEQMREQVQLLAASM